MRLYNYNEWEILNEKKERNDNTPERFRPKVEKAFDRDQKKMQFSMKVVQQYYKNTQINFGKSCMKLAGKITLTMNDEGIEVSNSSTTTTIGYDEYSRVQSIVKELLKEEGTSIEKEMIKKDLGANYQKLNK